MSNQVTSQSNREMRTAPDPKSLAYLVKSFSSRLTLFRVVSIEVLSNSTRSIKRVVPDNKIISIAFSPIKKEAGIKIAAQKNST
jgi:hypothetical protein